MQLLDQHLPDVVLNLRTAKDNPFEPYPHQQAAWDKLNAHFLKNRKTRGVLVVPTGGGKTALAARWLLREWVSQGGRVLWLAHRTELLLQAYSTFLMAAKWAASSPETPKERLKLILVSGEHASWGRVNGDDIVFSTVQSTRGNLGAVDQFFATATNGVFVVVDEAHHISAPSYQQVLETMKPYSGTSYLLGMTATPVRMQEADRRRLWNSLGEVVADVKREELIDKGILSVPHLEVVKTHCFFEGEFTAEERKHIERFKELGEATLKRIADSSKRNSLIVKRYQEYVARYARTIVFAVDIAHAMTLTREFREAGIRADYVASTRGAENSGVLQAYRDGSIQVLINVEMLTEGFDAPSTQTVFLTRPTGSEALLNQMIGRALRGPAAGGTRDAFIVSFLDEWKDFDIFHSRFAVTTGPVPEPRLNDRIPYERVSIPEELILEAYRLVQSRARGQLIGTFECFPERWYVWEEDTGNDLLVRRIFVLSHQIPGFNRLEELYGKGEAIPENLDQKRVERILDECFEDCPEPAPRWLDVLDLLRCWQRGQELEKCSLAEKQSLDPYHIAQEIRDLNEDQQEKWLTHRYTQDPLCQVIFRSSTAFMRDVVDAQATLRKLRMAANSIPPEVETSIPVEPSEWPAGATGYDLHVLMELVLSQPRHRLVEDEVEVKKLFYSKRALRSKWGWCSSDARICINRVLNSPDIPQLVVEFVLYHELLHAAMPNAGHNENFKRQESEFTPSEPAALEAKERALRPGNTRDAWFVLANQFLCGFDRKYTLPGDVRPRTM